MDFWNQTDFMMLPNVGSTKQVVSPYSEFQRNTMLNQQNAGTAQFWATESNPLTVGDPTQPLKPVVGGQDFWSLSNPEAWKSGAMALSGVAAIGNVGLGIAQLNQAKDQQAFNEKAFWTNYNMQMEDRDLAAKRRALANGSAQ